MITGEQVREARVLLNWSQMTLSQSAGYDVVTIMDFEAGRCALSRAISSAIRRALEEAGVEFPEVGPARLKGGAEIPRNWWEPPSRREQ